MKRILAYLKPHTRDSILAPLFKLTEALLELLIPATRAISSPAAAG